MNTKALPVGVEILDVELKEPLSQQEAEDLRRLLAEHQLLLFRSQRISPQDQIRLMEHLGNVLDEKGDDKRYQYVSGEETPIRPSRLLFHSDTHYTAVPLEYLSLYGEKVGDKAVPTLFVDNVAAYRRLSPTLRERLADVHVINRSFFHLGHSDKVARDLPPEWTGGPVARHPAVWRHRETGAPFVYLSEMHAFRLEGMTDEESYAVLDEVFDTLYDPALAYEHKWEDGDLVVWNNRTVQHARGPLPTESMEAGAARRSIRRVSVGPLSFSDQFDLAPDQMSVTEKA